jgi:hypothetical protein
MHASSADLHIGRARARLFHDDRETRPVSELYDTDIYTWSRRQAELLRRHAAGERLNESPDWANIIEEVESVGQSQIDAVESLWTQAFLHELKAAAWPDARDLEHWVADARLFRRQARRKYRPSMRQLLDVPSLYADALAGLPETMYGQEPQSVPRTCPLTIDDLLRDPEA